MSVDEMIDEIYNKYCYGDYEFLINEINGVNNGENHTAISINLSETNTNVIRFDNTRWNVFGDIYRFDKNYNKIGRVTSIEELISADILTIQLRFINYNVHNSTKLEISMIRGILNKRIDEKGCFIKIESNESYTNRRKKWMHKNIQL